MEDLIKKIIEFRDAREWKQFHDPKDLAISITLEATELLELFQWKNSEKVVRNNAEEIKDELADVLIYAFTLAHDLGIDIESAIANKMIKNALKYPI